MSDYADNLRLAFAAFSEGRLNEALSIAESVLAVNPDSPDALALAGQVQYQAGEFEQARQFLSRALEIVPGQAALLNNLSAVYLALGQAEKAASAAKQVTEQSVENFGAWLNLGLAMMAERKYEEAIRALEQALVLKPGHSLAGRKLAHARYRGGRSHLACRELLEQVLSHSPGDRETRALLADSFVQNAQISEGLGHFRQLLSEGDELSAERLSQLHSSYLIALQYDPMTTPPLLLESHKDWAGRYSMPHIDSGHHDTGHHETGHQQANDKLRIGWVSPRFSAGPVASFFLPVLTRLSREVGEHYLYSAYPHQDSVNEQFRTLATAWRELDGQNADQVAALIAADDLDILVDLSGHAPGGQLRALSQKPAPVQVSWLDSFATTGLAEMNCFFSDDFLSPPSDEAYFTEKLIRLEGGRLCYRPHVKLDQPMLRRGNEAIVFACFNRLAKLNAQVLKAWADILERVPGSRLELRNSLFDEKAAIHAFLERCEHAGIETGRIGINGSSDYETLMAAYQQTDIALDPFPFSGCTSSCDALWMGVPVISMVGETLVSRQSGAILNQLGLDDLVSSSVEDYIECAISLAGDRERLDSLRTGLRKRMQQEFDPDRFAISLYQALQQAVETG